MKTIPSSSTSPRAAAAAATIKATATTSFVDKLKNLVDPEQIPKCPICMEDFQTDLALAGTGGVVPSSSSNDSARTATTTTTNSSSSSSSFANPRNHHAAANHHHLPVSCCKCSVAICYACTVQYYHYVKQAQDEATQFSRADRLQRLRSSHTYHPSGVAVLTGPRQNQQQQQQSSRNQHQQQLVEYNSEGEEEDEGSTRTLSSLSSNEGCWAGPLSLNYGLASRMWKLIANHHQQQQQQDDEDEQELEEMHNNPSHSSRSRQSSRSSTTSRSSRRSRKTPVVLKTLPCPFCASLDAFDIEHPYYNRPFICLLEVLQTILGKQRTLYNDTMKSSSFLTQQTKVLQSLHRKLFHDFQWNSNTLIVFLVLHGSLVALSLASQAHHNPWMWMFVTGIILLSTAILKSATLLHASKPTTSVSAAGVSTRQQQQLQRGRIIGASSSSASSPAVRRKLEAYTATATTAGNNNDNSRGNRDNGYYYYDNDGRMMFVVTGNNNNTVTASGGGGGGGPSRNHSFVKRGNAATTTGGGGRTIIQQ